MTLILNCVHMFLYVAFHFLFLQSKLLYFDSLQFNKELKGIGYIERIGKIKI